MKAYHTGLLHNIELYPVIYVCPELAILPLSTMIFFQHGIDPHTPLRDWYFGTSFREKYDERLRKTAELHGEMMKGLGYRLKRIHKATSNGFQRRPSCCCAGGYFEKYKFHFIFSIFSNRAIEPTCFHRFFNLRTKLKN